MIKIICEAGLNWSNFNEAVEYAEKAKEINADIIKYQYVKEHATIKRMVNRELNEYYEEYLPQLTKGEWKALKGYCDKIGIEFLATPSSLEILEYLYDIGMKKCKFGSDRIGYEMLFDQYLQCDESVNFEIELVSDGYYDRLESNMYCVSLYPCDPKFIDFKKMKDPKYIAFSDHTLEYSKLWCDLIKECSNIQYVEKHFAISDNCIDKNVSLGYNEMKTFIKNLKG